LSDVEGVPNPAFVPTRLNLGGSIGKIRIVEYYHPFWDDF